MMQNVPRSKLIITEDLREDLWLVRREARANPNSDITYLRFDAVVQPGGIRLNGDGHDLDLLAAKIRVTQACLLGTGWCSTGPTVDEDFKRHLNWLRWRLGLGIPLTSQLTPEFFDKFCDDLSAKGSEGLVPVNRRVADLVRSVKNGEMEIPFRKGGDRIDWIATAHLLGLADFNSLKADAKRAIQACANFKDDDGQDCEREHVLHSEKTPGRLTVAGIAPLIENWKRLWGIRRLTDFDALQFNPFSGGKTPRSIAKLSGLAVKRTPDIPAYQACFLLDGALRWVLEYSKDLLGWLQAVTAVANRPHSSARKLTQALIATIPDGPLGFIAGAHLPLTPVYTRNRWQGLERPGDPPTFKTAVFRFLRAAAFIVLASFTMRRKTDLLKLRAVSLIKDEAGYWLEIWSSKGLRRFSKVPVPLCVVKAFDVLSELSADYRAASGKEDVFTTRELTRARLHLGFNTCDINSFAKHIGVPLVKGFEWHFTPHQFRKTYPLAYYFQFEYSHIAVLSEYMGHSGTGQTHHYLSEAISGAYGQMAEERRAAKERMSAEESVDGDETAILQSFEEARQQFIVHVCTLSESGESPLLGSGGQFIMQEMRKLKAAAARSTVVVSGSRDTASVFSDYVVEFAKGNTLTPHVDGHTYCKCGSSKSDLVLAECLKCESASRGVDATIGASGPSRAFADVFACLSCPHAVRRRENIIHLEDQEHRQRRNADRPTAPYLQEAAQTRADKLRVYVEGMFVDLEKLSVNTTSRTGPAGLSKGGW